MGQMNDYGSNNHSCVDTSATLFIVIERYKKHEVDPRAFILICLECAAEGIKLETPLSFARRTRRTA
jgi:hypothetical protein